MNWQRPAPAIRLSGASTIACPMGPRRTPAMPNNRPVTSQQAVSRQIGMARYPWRSPRAAAQAASGDQGITATNSGFHCVANSAK